MSINHQDEIVRLTNETLRLDTDLHTDFLDGGELDRRQEETFEKTIFSDIDDLSDLVSEIEHVEPCDTEPEDLEAIMNACFAVRQKVQVIEKLASDALKQLV